MLLVFHNRSKAHGAIKSYSAKVLRSSEAPVSDFSGGVNHQHGVGRPDPPLVLYCGANPKVEEVSYACWLLWSSLRMRHKVPRDNIGMRRIAEHKYIIPSHCELPCLLE